MPLARKELTSIITNIEDDIKTGLSLAGFGNVDFTFRRSVLKVLARTMAGALHEMYGKLVWLSVQLFPDTAEGEYLERWSTIWGIIRQPAEKASGYIVITGEENAVYQNGDLLARNDGERFVCQDNGILDATGTADVEVIAEMGGEDGNTATGGKLTWLSPSAGMDPETTVKAPGLAGGEDIESDSDLLNRLLARIKLPPHGGIQADYVNWALEYSGVTRAWCYPLLYGEGTVGLYFVMDNKTTYPDLVRNGDFSDDTSGDWTFETGWALSGGKAVATSAAAYTAVYQYVDATPGRDYRVTYTVEDLSAGTVRCKLGNTYGTIRSANGTYDEVLTCAGSGDIQLRIESNTTLTCKIDDVFCEDEVSEIIPGAAEIDAVYDYIDTKKPVTAALYVERLEAREVIMTITLISFTGVEADVKAAIETALDDLFYREGEPPDDPSVSKKLLVSHVREAISGAVGEIDHSLDSLDGTSPAADVTISNGEILLRGTITWS
jgi:uncharacterized phage protein gp47/JayE